MRGSESYEWLLDSCLRECRKGISHLEQIALTTEQNREWLRDELFHLHTLEASAMSCFAALKRSPHASEDQRIWAQEKLDRLQASLLECFHHLASEEVSTLEP